jgi:hypothetical protein
MSETPALLSVGINSGGMTSANREVHEALASFQRRVIQTRDLFANEGLKVNIVFDLPGNLFRPDYEGVRVARFDSRHTHLLVIAAVPENLTVEGVPDYVNYVLEAVRTEARAEAAKRRVTSLDAVEAVIDRLEA